MSKQPLLFVSLGNRHFREIDPVGLESPALRQRTGHQVEWRSAIALLSGPRRISLARVDDGTGEIVGKCGRTS